MQVTEDDEDWVSALADGQVQGEAFARRMAQLAQSEEARATWHTYHVIGDVMRAGDEVDCRGDKAFLQRLRASLAQEAPLPNTTIAINNIAASPITERAVGLKHLEKLPANDARFRWTLWGVAASVALVSLGAWQALTGGADPAAAPALAQVSPAAQAAEPRAVARSSLAATNPTEPQVMVRDPHLDALLSAHQQFGGTSALQMPTGFIRNATFEGARR